MQLIENYLLAEEVIQMLEEEYLIDKPLPHTAELIYCLTKAYYDRTEPIAPTRREVCLFAIGFGLEKVLLKGMKRIESMTVDGIGFSPDFITLGEVPGELKTTRKSMNKFDALTMPDTWKKQILTYMHCLGITEYKLIVLFICGDYKPPFPDTRAFDVIASPEEIEENWKWMLDRKEIYLSCHQNKVVPPAGMLNESWECEECRYKIRCWEAGMKEKAVC